MKQYASYTNNNRYDTLSKTVKQATHDVVTPIAALRSMSDDRTLPANTTKLLKIIAGSVEGIMKKLQNANNASAADTTHHKFFICGSAIWDVVMERQYTYRNQLVNIKYERDIANGLARIQGSSSDFKRMLSNLINNAVDACIGKENGTVTIVYITNARTLQITIADNGCGMPSEVQHKILSGIAVTSGKSDGHGIGFTQVTDTLRQFNAEIDIESQIGVGTSITLNFPVI